MKPEDQKAFDEALVNRCKTVVTVPQDFEAGWNEALAHRDAAPAGAQGEPVALLIEHPIQPLQTDKEGVLRFKENSIVSFLSEGKLNELAVMGFPREDWVQFAQLIGYSLSGWGTLSYVSDEDWERANKNHPAAAINEQMLEVLRLIRGKHGCGALTLPQADLERVNAAIAAAEKAKGGV